MQASHIVYSVMAGRKAQSTVFTPEDPAIHALLHEILGSRFARPRMVG
jgi:hypothetical protein